MSKLKTIIIMVICRIVWLISFMVFLLFGTLVICTMLEDVSFTERLQACIFPGAIAIVAFIIAAIGLHFEFTLKKTL